MRSARQAPSLTSVSRALSLALAMVACAGLACGGDSEEDRVRSAIGDAQDAFAAGQLEQLCGMLSSDARQHIGAMGHDVPGEVSPTPCIDDMPVVYEGIKQKRGWRETVERDVVGVDLHGRRATVTVRFDDDATGEVPMVKEGGRWRIDALFGGMPGGQQEDHF